MLATGMNPRTRTSNGMTLKQSSGFRRCVWLGIVAFLVQSYVGLSAFMGEHELQLIEIWNDYFDLGQ